MSADLPDRASGANALACLSSWGVPSSDDECSNDVATASLSTGTQRIATLSAWEVALSPDVVSTPDEEDIPEAPALEQPCTSPLHTSTEPPWFRSLMRLTSNICGTCQCAGVCKRSVFNCGACEPLAIGSRVAPLHAANRRRCYELGRLLVYPFYPLSFTFIFYLFAFILCL